MNSPFMMLLDTVGLLLDFGLVVLIWMVQLVVYPSFLHYSSKNLIVWHNKYTSIFSPIVIPLMVGQLGISFYDLITSTSLYALVNLILIGLVWASTFLQFVPIHLTISKGSVNEKMLTSLVNKNWVRTVLWTLIFVFSFINHII